MTIDLEETIGRFLEGAKEAAGSELVAVVLYGSAACGQHRPGRSNLNFLVIVTKVDRAILDRLQVHVGRWKKERIATPVVVPEAFLRESTDSYPLEILGMLVGYRVLFGPDLLRPLQLQKEEVRLQVEREIKSKQLFLEAGYVESCGKHLRLLDLLIGAVPAMMVMLRGLLYLKNLEWKEWDEAFFDRCRTELGIEAQTVQRVYEARRGGRRPNREETIELYDRILHLLNKLSIQVEKVGTAG